ncbi:MAG: transposase [Patescibacteria group bacterium]|nr:transposase [Patescibacteria group bacterium]
MIKKTIQLKIKEPDVFNFNFLRQEYSKTLNLGIEYIASQYPKKIKQSQLYNHLKPMVALPSSVLSEAVRLVRSRWITFCKQKKQHIKTSIPHFKNAVAVSFNNQNWTVHKISNTYFIGFPVNGSKPYFELALSQKQKDVLDKLIQKQIRPCAGQLLERKGKWYFFATIDFPEPVQISSTNVLGVDLGLNNLAVCYDKEQGKTIFFSGKEVRFRRTKYAARRKLLDKAKKLHAIKSKNKERRWMRDFNHKLSRQIVNLALKLKANINLENLKYIRTTAKSNHKQRQKLSSTLHNWPFDQLKRFIEYKAKELGIRVNLINSSYTSQECPKCHHIDSSNRNGNVFHCRACGYKSHADRVGAINIANRQPDDVVTASLPGIVYPSRDGLLGTAPNLRVAQTGNGQRASTT